MVIWITGLSGAGKTTLAQAVRALVKPCLPELVLLDGDAVRSISSDLSYRESDRVVQVKRLQGLAKILSDQGQVVIVSVLYAHPDLLAWNRRSLADYFEVYVRASLDLVRSRDTKGLYRGGEVVSDVVGIDIPWHEPLHADLVIDADKGEPADAVARRLAAAVPRLSAALPRETNLSDSAIA